MFQFTSNFSSSDLTLCFSVCSSAAVWWISTSPVSSELPFKRFHFSKVTLIYNCVSPVLKQLLHPPQQEWRGQLRRLIFFPQMDVPLGSLPGWFATSWSRICDTILSKTHINKYLLNFNFCIHFNIAVLCRSTCHSWRYLLTLLIHCILIYLSFKWMFSLK